MLCEFGLAMREDFVVEGAAVGIHRDDGGETIDFQFPDGFGRAEFFEEIDVADFFDAFGKDLGGAADAVEINTAVLPAGFECFVTHAAFADDTADSKVPNDLPLVRLLTNGSGGAGGGDFPVAVLILNHDRSAMIDDSVA